MTVSPEQTLVRADDMVLVVVDPQERLAAVMADRDAVISRTSKLVRVAALVGAPIILTRQYPKGLGPAVEQVVTVLEDVESAGASVERVDKLAFCCAAEPTFETALQATGRHQVVVVGMETHICVAQTALALAGQDYQVQVVADACCSRERESHDVALARLRSAGITVTLAECVMYEAVGVAATETFRQLLKIVKE